MTSPNHPERMTVSLAMVTEPPITDLGSSILTGLVRGFEGTGAAPVVSLAGEENEFVLTQLLEAESDAAAVGRALLRTIDILDTLDHVITKITSARVADDETLEFAIQQNLDSIPSRTLTDHANDMLQLISNEAF